MEQDLKNKIEDIYELSPMQQGMLFHTLYEEGSDAYFEQFCYDLEGKLNEENFEKAWNEIVKRHGVLRTSFQWKGISKPVQVLNRTFELPWENLDWTDIPSQNTEDEFIKFIRQDRAKGFAMETAPLMRCTLIKLKDDLYKFVWSFHHILMDGWSYPVIQKEVFEFYEAFQQGKNIELNKPVSYKQFIVWLNTTDKEAAKKFWKSELKGMSSPTPMITDRNEKSGEIKDIEIKLSEGLTADLNLFVRKNKLTMNSVIQGVWAFILSKYRNEKDVMFGGTVSGRNPLLKGIESMVGLFINTLPVRINISDDEEILTWLSELQSKQVERDQFSYSALVDIQEWSEIARGTQLFENILVFENYPVDKKLEEGIAGIKIRNLKAFERTNFPLTVLIAPGNELTIHIAFETAKFTDDFIRRILSHFRSLIEQIINDPSGKLSGLSLMDEQEKDLILFERNKTVRDLDNKCVHRLFEDAVKNYSDETALESGKGKLSYRELNERSNQLAHFLIKKDIRPDDKIGISISRSAEMIIALLGILKSGAAYVPIDPSFPKERIDYLIKDSGIKILITSSELSDRFEDGNFIRINIDKEKNILDKESRTDPDTNVNPDHLAYVIYTSGSTGKPKGVLMMHKSLSNLLNWQMTGHEFNKGFRVLQFTTLSFDVSFQEIFSTWISGGTLVMLTEEERKDLSEVVSIIKKKKIRRIFLPFVALQGISEIYSSSGIKDLELKEVITAGEQVQITPALINFFKGLSDFVFSNHYGPSEAHVVTSYTFSRDTSEWPEHPPIGKPIYNNRIYILDSKLQPVPDGVTGDLYIGGISLVRGYLDRPELTRDKFTEDPFIKGERIYHTGDLARYIENGDIEFLGRADNQIKLRGYRIELGEIENVISEFGGIKNVAVISKEFVKGDKRLFAYIVAPGSNGSDKEPLRAFLKSRLPDYMIPQDFIFIKEMPLTGTGKVDLKALPEPEISKSDRNSEYAVPKDPLELQLVNIWEKVLGIKNIGVRDNFFELGGHSLLAMRVFGYIEKLTGKKLALSTLFNSPTIEQLASILKDEGWKPTWKSLVAVKPGGSKLPFYCVPPAAGTALHFQDLVKYIPDDQPFYILESVGLDGKEEPHTDLKEMASHYIKEIQSLQPDGPYLLGGRCFGGRVVFEMAQQLVKKKQKVALVAIFDTWPPFTETPQDYIPPTRDTRHFITRTFHHLKSGDFFKVAWNYTRYRASKINWKIKNKLEYLFSDELERKYKEIMLMHFKAQDRYVAQRYPGKITLIECATFRKDFRDKWKELAGGGFETYVVPDTDHKTIVKEPKLKDFAEKLNIVLEKTHIEINAGSSSASGSPEKAKQALLS
ncbi:MAG: amino acid adenylation domain-containing protein [Bacteroidetes bacterium]|nr:amino acid adenylation domain-containing protein [Bacteroidota bacterium]